MATLLCLLVVGYASGPLPGVPSDFVSLEGTPLTHGGLATIAGIPIVVAIPGHRIVTFTAPRINEFHLQYDGSLEYSARTATDPFFLFVNVTDEATRTVNTTASFVLQALPGDSMRAAVPLATEVFTDTARMPHIVQWSGHGRLLRDARSAAKNAYLLLGFKVSLSAALLSELPPDTRSLRVIGDTCRIAADVHLVDVEVSFACRVVSLDRSHVSQADLVVSASDAAADAAAAAAASFKRVAISAFHAEIPAESHLAHYADLTTGPQFLTQELCEFMLLHESSLFITQRNRQARTIGETYLGFFEEHPSVLESVPSAAAFAHRLRLHARLLSSTFSYYGFSSHSSIDLSMYSGQPFDAEYPAALTALFEAERLLQALSPSSQAPARAREHAAPSALLEFIRLQVHQEEARSRQWASKLLELIPAYQELHGRQDEFLARLRAHPTLSPILDGSQDEAEEVFRQVSFARKLGIMAALVKVPVVDRSLVRYAYQFTMPARDELQHIASMPHAGDAFIQRTSNTLEALADGRFVGTDSDQQYVRMALLESLPLAGPSFMTDRRAQVWFQSVFQVQSALALSSPFSSLQGPVQALMEDLEQLERRRMTLSSSLALSLERRAMLLSVLDELMTPHAAAPVPSLGALLRSVLIVHERLYFWPFFLGAFERERAFFPLPESQPSAGSTLGTMRRRFNELLADAAVTHLDPTALESLVAPMRTLLRTMLISATKIEGAGEVELDIDLSMQQLWRLNKYGRLTVDVWPQIWGHIFKEENVRILGVGTKVFDVQPTDPNELALVPQLNVLHDGNGVARNDSSHIRISSALGRIPLATTSYDYRTQSFSVLSGVEMLAGVAAAAASRPDSVTVGSLALSSDDMPEKLAARLHHPWVPAISNLILTRNGVPPPIPLETLYSEADAGIHHAPTRPHYTITRLQLQVRLMIVRNGGILPAVYISSDSSGPTFGLLSPTSRSSSSSAVLLNDCAMSLERGQYSITVPKIDLEGNSFFRWIEEHRGTPADHESNQFFFDTLKDDQHYRALYVRQTPPPGSRAARWRSHKDPENDEMLRALYPSMIIQ